MYKAYVPGVGWCWLEDGEVVEVIDDDALVGLRGYAASALRKGRSGAEPRCCCSGLG